MAQTKRKRRSKHRGNAAGTIESRGRPGAKPVSGQKRSSGAAPQRGRRQAKPPSWNVAFLKAALMAAVLFALTRFGLLGDEAPLAQSLILCLMALVIYTPAAYFTDKLVYNRQLKKAQQQARR
jgi:hypothetical protein